MQTGFTGERPWPRPPSTGETQLIFTLDQYDFVECWLYEWERSPAAAKGGNRPWAFTGWPLGVVLVALLAPLGFLLADTDGDLQAFIALAALVLFAILGALVVGAHPRWLFPQSERAAHLARMKEKARALEEAGEVINRARIYWLFMAPEGLTQIAELRADRGGITRYEYREASAPWAMVEDVVQGGSHVFFVVSAGSPWIVPLSCLPDRRARDNFVNQALDFLHDAGAPPR